MGELVSLVHCFQSAVRLLLLGVFLGFLTATFRVRFLGSGGTFYHTEQAMILFVRLKSVAEKALKQLVGIRQQQMVELDAVEANFGSSTTEYG